MFRKFYPGGLQPFDENPSDPFHQLVTEIMVALALLAHPLLELIKTRASQINECAFCLDMHTKDARAAGESEQYLYALSARHETPFFTERKHAALAWTEAVSRVAEMHVPDDLFELVRKQFTEKELASLTLAIVTINGWNQLAIAFRKVAGIYQPAKR